MSSFARRVFVLTFGHVAINPSRDFDLRFVAAAASGAVTQARGKFPKNAEVTRGGRNRKRFSEIFPSSYGNFYGAEFYRDRKFLRVSDMRASPSLLSSLVFFFCAQLATSPIAFADLTRVCLHLPRSEIFPVLELWREVRPRFRCRVVS